MAAPGNGPRSHEVHCSPVVIKRIHEMHRRATRQGRGSAVTAALRRVVQELERDPATVGEPNYRLPGLRMQVRTRIVPPLVVHFAVCEDRPLVFIKGVKLLGPRSP